MFYSPSYETKEHGYISDHNAEGGTDNSLILDVGRAYSADVVEG